MPVTATDDFSVAANAGERLKADPLPDGHPGGDGLVAVADRAPLFKVAGETDLPIGTDGDDTGSPQTKIRDMLNSGHGFLVRAFPDRSKPPRTFTAACTVCGGPIPGPGEDPNWLCQYFGDTSPTLVTEPDGTRYDPMKLASLTCNCPWCRSYQEYYRGAFKPKGGRPRQRCGSKECDRKADAERKARKRLQKRRERLLAECSAEADEPPPTIADIEEGLSRIDEVPEQHREAVRLGLMQRLHCLRKRGEPEGVRKTPQLVEG